MIFVDRLFGLSLCFYVISTFAKNYYCKLWSLFVIRKHDWSWFEHFLFKQLRDQLCCSLMKPLTPSFPLSHFSSLSHTLSVSLFQFHFISLSNTLSSLSHSLYFFLSLSVPSLYSPISLSLSFSPVKAFSQKTKWFRDKVEFFCLKNESWEPLRLT